MGVSPTAAAKRLVHRRYDFFSALVGSRLQASCSHGTIRKTASWTRASAFPPWALVMYSSTFCPMLRSEIQAPNHLAFGANAIVARRFFRLPSP